MFLFQIIPWLFSQICYIPCIIQCLEKCIHLVPVFHILLHFLVNLCSVKNRKLCNIVKWKEKSNLDFFFFTNKNLKGQARGQIQSVIKFYVAQKDTCIEP